MSIIYKHGFIKEQKALEKIIVSGENKGCHTEIRIKKSYSQMNLGVI